MKKPKNWSLTIADQMVFMIFVVVGWKLFKQEKAEYEVKNFCTFVDKIKTYESFVSKIEKEMEEETSLGEIVLYIPQYFFLFLYRQIKLKKKDNEMDSKDLEYAWDLYIEFLEFAHNNGLTEEKDIPIEEQFNPQILITMCHKRLQEMNRYDQKMIDYFIYLSNQAIEEFKTDTQN